MPRRVNESASAVTDLFRSTHFKSFSRLRSNTVDRVLSANTSRRAASLVSIIIYVCMEEHRKPVNATPEHESGGRATTCRLVSCSLSVPLNVMEIPGFYYDPERNRYFRIGSGGPEFRDRVRSAQREAEKKANQQKLEKIKCRTPHSVDDASLSALLVKRHSLYTNVRSATVKQAATRALLRRLTADTQVIIPAYRHITTTGTTTIQGDEAVLTFEKLGILRIGFQCEPYFHAWMTSHCWRPVPGDIVAIDLSREMRHGNCSVRKIVGVSNEPGRRTGGRLWQVTVPPLGPPSHEEMQMLRDSRPLEQGNISYKRGYLADLTQLRMANSPPPPIDVNATWRNVLFNCLDVQRKLNVICLGSQTGFHYMDSGFDGQHFSKTPTGVTSVKAATQNILCAGLRDGRLFIFDARRANKSMHIPHSRSAIAHMAPLGKSTFENQVLIVDVQGKIAIWDVRYIRKKPVRTLLGHEGAPTVAFDADVETNTIAVSGADNRLRLWSLDYDRTMDYDRPLWESSQFDGPVRFCKIMSQPPPQPSTCFAEYSHRRSPGIMASAPVNGKPTIHWFTIPA